MSPVITTKCKHCWDPVDQCTCEKDCSGLFSREPEPERRGLLSRDPEET